MEVKLSRTHQTTTYPQKSSHRKRKQSQETEAPHNPGPAEKRRKRGQISVVGVSCKQPLNHIPTGSVNGGDENPIGYWSRHGRWPGKYFEERSDMKHLLARKKSETSLARKHSDAGSVAPSSTTPSDEKPREAKSAPYKHPGYKTLLATCGTFMSKSEQGIADSSKSLCRDLFTKPQRTPADSLFRDDLFEETCGMIQDRNEAKVIQDIARLIVPSAQTLAVYGSMHLKKLVESVNEGWNNAIPLTKTRPQPDYAVGFRREAFTVDQLKKIEPFVGSLFDVSYFMATYYMYFPFLTCEVKCGAAALDTADRQNAHSMTLAVRGVVELFRYVKREKEIDREILAFSIAHDDRAVRIYGYYAEINGPEQKYYRHPIHEFSFTALDGKEKWTAYKFTKNVYDIWMPSHFQRICSVIEEFPWDVNFELSQQSELQFTEASGLSRQLETYSMQSFASSQSSLEVAENQSSFVDAQNITPNTSVNESGRVKRPRRDRGHGRN